MRKSIQIPALKFRLWHGIIVALTITLISVLTIGIPVPFKVLLLIGVSRFVYCIAIWLVYQVCSGIKFRYKFFNFLLYLAICIIAIIPLIPYNIWVNGLTNMYYPPFGKDALLEKDKWQYYAHFYFLRALTMGIAVYIIHHREDLVQEKQSIRLINEKLTQQNLMIQLEALRQQINPHFLFNTLNSLKVLIGTNPKQAENYTIELSNVYRYLLNHRKSDTVSLCEEMDFLKSYLTLLKIRFEDNFSITISVDTRHNFYRIIPFSLQILVENAVKHNIITKDKPLQVNIFVNSQEDIVVENKIQPRLTTEGSSQYGLYHLAEQFRLLTERDIDIIKNKTTFSVHLPLIKPNAI